MILASDCGQKRLLPSGRGGRAAWEEEFVLSFFCCCCFEFGLAALFSERSSSLVVMVEFGEEEVVIGMIGAAI